jgi:regulator of replication initiation timing
VKEQVNDISFLISEIHGEMQSMRKTIDSQHAEICQLNRNSQAQLKEIRKLRKENELLRKRLSKYEQPPKNSGNSSTPPTKERMKDEVIRRTNTIVKEIRHYVKICRFCGKRVHVSSEHRRSNAVVYD